MLRSYSSLLFPSFSSRSLNLDNQKQIAESTIVKQPEQQPIKRRQIKRLVFIGIFCLWAKPRLPPDIASADDPTNPTNDSGRDAVVVSNRPVTPRHAADVSGLDLGDGYLRSSWSSGIYRQWSIPLRLMGSFFIVVGNEVVQDSAQPVVSKKPTPANTLALHRADPTLCEGIAVGTVRWDLLGLDASVSQNLLPAWAKLPVAIVNQVAATNLLQPTIVHGLIPGSLSHVGFIGVLRDAKDLDLPRAQVDCKEDVVGLLARPCPDVDREEVGGNQAVHLVGDEALPVAVSDPLRCMLETMPFQDGSDGARREGDQTEDEHASDAHLTPGRILLGHAQHNLLNRSLRAWLARSATVSAQLPCAPQTFPALDRFALGDRCYLGESLPADSSSMSSEAQSPDISEAEACVRRQLFSVVSDLRSEVGDLGDEHLVLFGSNGRSDQPREEWQVVVHRAAQAQWRRHVGNDPDQEVRRAA